MQSVECVGFGRRFFFLGLNTRAGVFLCEKPGPSGERRPSLSLRCSPTKEASGTFARSPDSTRDGIWCSHWEPSFVT